jgi:hypothetical protein
MPLNSFFSLGLAATMRARIQSDIADMILPHNPTQVSFDTQSPTTMRTRTKLAQICIPGG